MPSPTVVIESATIAAPMERCFALSTRVELVQRTLGMTLIATDAPHGHIVAQSRVHWRGWKFGLPTEHHTLITGFTAPRADADTAWFQDSQERGRFAFFQHDHFFAAGLDPATGAPVTTLRDEVRFRLPFGPLGSLAARWLMAPHVRKLVRQRYAIIKTLAEGDGWQQWVASPH